MMAAFPTAARGPRAINGLRVPTRYWPTHFAQFCSLRRGDPGERGRAGIAFLVSTWRPGITGSAAKGPGQCRPGVLSTIPFDVMLHVLTTRSTLQNYVSEQPTPPVPACLPRFQLRCIVARSDAVAEYARARAQGTCEICGRSAPFVTPRGEPYLEVHHVLRLADDGPDDIFHVAAICPNCHREAHHGVDPRAYQVTLRDLIAEKEPKGRLRSRKD